MTEQLSTLIKDLKENSISFTQVLAFIETYYQHQPAAFKNGDVHNEATQNQGSAKVFAFAQLNNLSKEDTLYLFAEHYQSVLATPMQPITKISGNSCSTVGRGFPSKARR